MLYLKGTRIMMFQLSGFYYRRFRGQVYEECLRRIQVYKLGCLACDGASFVGLRIAVVFTATVMMMMKKKMTRAVLLS